MRAFLFPLIAALMFSACSSSADLPVVDSPPQLTADCDIIVQDVSITLAVGKDKWPDSIKALNPVTVEKQGTAIYITTFAETGVGARGYVVAHDTPAATDHYTISGTSYPGVYRFDFKP